MTLAAQDGILKGSSLCGKVRYEIRGSPLYSEAGHRRGILSIRCGLLDGDPGIRPAHHLYVDFKPPWYDFHDGLPEYPEEP